MSNEEPTQIEKFVAYLPTQGQAGKILFNLLNVTTKVVDTEGKVAGMIEENFLLQDATLTVIDPLFFQDTEYYRWAIEKHERSMERVERRLMAALNLTRSLSRIFTSFLKLP
ncbi:hypothetical protein KAR91_45915 [Candidatus Pacearchaeota archaeon]|nr:hypothetical protein [Candidatus Pacearchaeota archaeon]